MPQVLRTVSNAAAFVQEPVDIMPPYRTVYVWRRIADPVLDKEIEKDLGGEDTE